MALAYGKIGDRRWAVDTAGPLESMVRSSDFVSKVTESSWILLSRGLAKFDWHFKLITSCGEQTIERQKYRQGYWMRLLSNPLEKLWWLGQGW